MNVPLHYPKCTPSYSHWVTNQSCMRACGASTLSERTAYYHISHNSPASSSFSSLADDSEEARVRYFYKRWVGLGLSDVRLSNHTVLVSLPGSTPSTITDKSSHQCFLPSGVPCDQRGANELPRQRFSYAAYSAAGSLQVQDSMHPAAGTPSLRMGKLSESLFSQVSQGQSQRGHHEGPSQRVHWSFASNSTSVWLSTGLMLTCCHIYYDY